MFLTVFSLYPVKKVDSVHLENGMMLLRYGGRALCFSLTLAVFLGVLSFFAAKQKDKSGISEYLNRRQKIFYGVSLILFIIAFIITSIISFLKDNFNSLSLEEVIFHLKVPMRGTSNSMIIEYFKYAKIGFIAFFTICISGVIFLGMYKKIRNNKVYNLATFAFSIILLFTSIGEAGYSLEVLKYIKRQLHTSTFIEDNYVDPNLAKMTFPDKKRNLIYIFMESMESTFISKEEGGSMNTNLIPELTELAKKNINFSETELVGGATVAVGGGWTIGAMVSQSTGLPLLIPIEANSYGEYSTFLPGATSIGEILQKAGYNQEIMVGSDMGFAGRDLFYQQHGNYQIWDYNTAVDKGKIASDYYVWWGYEDKKLYEYAKEEITRLSREDKPFNFTMLTVDTHHIGGWLCDLCKNTSESQYENVLACASRQVYDFVQWIQQQDFYDNTTIVITGDHPTMDEDYMQGHYDGTTPRKVYDCLINSVGDLSHEKERAFNTFDLFPTTLAAMGVEIEGDKLALGTNLFSGEKTLAEQYGYDIINEEFSCSSKFYNKYILGE